MMSSTLVSQVREDPDLRCSAKSSKTTGAVKAQVACAAACGRCAGVCKDSDTWSTLHENGLPIGCEYLGRGPCGNQRCAAAESFDTIASTRVEESQNSEDAAEEAS